MEIITIKPVSQQWLTASDVGKLIGRKKTSTNTFLKSFKDFVDDRPNFFKGVKPIAKHDGSTALYNYWAINCYLENKDLLDARSRSISFKEYIHEKRELGIL